MSGRSNGLISDELYMLMDKVKSTLGLSSTWDSQHKAVRDALNEDRCKSVTNIGKYSKRKIFKMQIRQQ